MEYCYSSSEQDLKTYLGCQNKMTQNILKSLHRVELGGYNYWPLFSQIGIRLYSYEEIPTFLKGNPYITDGYRAYLPSSLCIRSLFVLSNESVNIWSHLLGFFLFFVMGLHDTCFLLPSSNSTRDDYIVFIIFGFCFQFCMLCSAGYHLFCCHHSEKTSQQWLALDYAGVSVGMLGCYVPGVFYAFYCAEQYWRQVYLITVLAMIFVMFLTQIHPHYASQHCHKLRILLFCFIAAYGLIPTIHWIFQNGGIGEPVVKVFAPRVGVMYLLASLAFLFYYSKVPERYFPGQPWVYWHKLQNKKENTVDVRNLKSKQKMLGKLNRSG
ncbi:progestin and adipoQ receptor family member 3-like isoform X3 [Scyliorhinus canicula]|uniref:progestin and adipoQ receptor family member 3-like isoform X3 n=1 Tax=Scyliorhinus canicula TaxID=7830 RepID=UPI0018F5B331|nr:progestin and adipoQ receptor family member 3-like isoform X3 [Scyliorhinus canicula]